jgi:hypothetical protein
MERWLFRLFVVLTLGCLGAGAYFVCPRFEETGSWITVDSLEHDLGEVPVGTEYPLTYQIRNSSRQPRVLQGTGYV